MALDAHAPGNVLRNAFGTASNRRWFGTAAELLDVPNLVRHQIDSFARFSGDGLREVFEEMSPIADFTGKNMELELAVPEGGAFGAPKHTEDECRDRDLTYDAPLYADARLRVLHTGEIKESRVFLGDFPLMTPRGTFIINGSERVVVSQLVRSPGVYFTAQTDPASGRRLAGAKVIPSRGAWLELETSAKDVISVKIDRKRKIPVTTLLRAVGPAHADDDALLALFSDVDTGVAHRYVEATIGLNGATRKDPTHSHEEALIDLHRRLRPGDPATLDSARTLLSGLFFNARRYDLSRVGRYKLNKRLWSGHADRPSERTLTPRDLIAIVREVIRLNVTHGSPDDIDHLGNRRVRAVGELIQNQFRLGLSRLERGVRDRMTIQDPDTATLATLINIRPLVAAMKEFFGGSQLSQFMDQTNPLAELTHKRRLSALGPGGLSRERAGFDVRDVHESHYGRICPVETQEGTSIGLVGALATYGRINDYGFIETPYRRVVDNRVTDEIAYLTADEEERYVIAQASSPVDEGGCLTEFRVAGRHGGAFGAFPPERVDLIDVSPKQIVSVSTAMIPFLEHDDAARALMGANYQRQAVPLLQPEAPLVATGLEAQAARDSGRLLLATASGTVASATAAAVTVRDDSGREHRHTLHQFMRTNDGTCLHHRPIVAAGEPVQAGQVIADTMSTENGELALGQNVLCAFMFWEGGNFEDAILISERLVQDDKFTSIHLEHYEVDARDTKLGPEEITRDLPNLSEETLRSLDEHGCVYAGARVQPGDVLVGKITPKGETELTAEERLLRAIFGEKAREVKDTSLRVPSGEYGTVVDVRRFRRDVGQDGHDGDDLPATVGTRVRVTVAVKRKLTEGDKLSGRHGNKGVIARILPVEDMPYLADGTPVDVILSPLGAPSRMNVGTVLETHIGWAAHALGIKIATPVFDSAREEEIEALLERAGLPKSGKATLYDGRTGEPFEQEVCVGHVYLLKLHHLVEDKVHARSTGPYSLITQQPLGGKAQFGGQRLGLMEVWALEAYGAAHTLQEMLTVKSDDDTGRVKTYEAIVKGTTFPRPSLPASFRLVVKELQSLALNVELFDGSDDCIVLTDADLRDDDPVTALDVNLQGWEDRD